MKKKTDRKVYISETATAKQILKELNKYLKNEYYINGVIRQSEQEKLQSILSALRGPDDENYKLKKKTTAIIRGLALSNYCGVVASKEELKQFKEEYKEQDSFKVANSIRADHQPLEHFERHFKRALEAWFGK